MKISIEKSCYMIFTKSTREELNLDLKIYGDNLKRQHEIKFLGIRFDSRLTFSPLIDELKEHFNFPCLNSLSDTNIQKLQTIQNSAVRSILKLRFDTPSSILYHEAHNKLKFHTISNRLFELSERYVRAGLTYSVPVLLRLELTLDTDLQINNKSLFLFLAIDSY
ncbi:hypothetical protein BpHYR1_034787 [Brachionus plicatilis]|uniref:RNA-directed DNA polymerase from mobile element jockey-like n=1 Tax=Brachionus plicatilis TaxID=10195 RepID=A0A3M7QA33_BRAPC|nr:hypothetical protein BpHYR1_034787 [Brachionus plicatilis]